MIFKRHRLRHNSSLTQSRLDQATLGLPCVVLECGVFNSTQSTARGWACWITPSVHCTLAS